MREKRNTALDLIKAIAIFGVIIIHVSSRLLTSSSVGSSAWTSGLLFGTILRSAVPLFLMVSGVLMLNPEKPLTIKKLYFKSIFRIIIAMLFWGFLYKLYHLWGNSQFTFRNLLYSVKELVLFDQEFHFYYIHMILIVYIFLPLSRFFVEKADKKLTEYFIAVWFVFSIIYPAARAFSPISLLSGITNQWAINLTYASIGYGIFGFYLYKYPLSLKKAVIYFLCGLIFTLSLTYYLSAKAGYLNEIYLQGTTLGIFLMAMGIFSIAPYIKLRGIFEKIVIYISKASFLIYLSHMFILYIAEKNSITAFSFNAYLSVPLISVTTLIICTGLYAVISKTPILKKWIV